MHIRLHKNARTTPATRAEIAASDDSVATLAARYHVGEGTIRHWRKRSVFADASHIAQADNEYAMIDATIVRAHQHSTGAKGGLRSKPSGAAEAG